MNMPSVGAGELAALQPVLQGILAIITEGRTSILHSDLSLRGCLLYKQHHVSDSSGADVQPQAAGKPYPLLCSHSDVK